MFSMNSEGFWKDLWNQHVFLTNLTHSLITIYYACVFLQDINELSLKKEDKEKKEESLSELEYATWSYTFYQLVLSMSLIVGIGYWGLMIINPKLLWGERDPETMNIYYAMTYLHGFNHLHLYIELFMFKQKVVVSKSKKFCIDVVTLALYFAMTAIHYIQFDNIVYAF